MQNNKLQELTDKLYKEGLCKGQEEAQTLIAKAQEEAQTLIANAKKEAEQIIADAKKEAQDYSQKVQSDLKMAASQAIEATKQDIETLIVYNLTKESISANLSSIDFIKQIISAVATKFSTQEQCDLSLVLPESQQQALEPFINNELSKLLNKNIQYSFSNKINGGFTIGPANGSFYISLTEETFTSLISEYLRPTTKKLLFGN